VVITIAASAIRSRDHSQATRNGRNRTTTSSAATARMNGSA